MTSSTQYLGKYRGTVVNNVDPMQQGRIQAIVPDVSSLVPSSWAMPCVPFGGMNTGMFAVPMIGAGVWIEFEQGDPDYPIWVGTYWGNPAELPTLARTVPPPIPAVVMQTPLNNGVASLMPEGLWGLVESHYKRQPVQ